MQLFSYCLTKVEMPCAKELHGEKEDEQKQEGEWSPPGCCFFKVAGN